MMNVIPFFRALVLSAILTSCAGVDKRLSTCELPQPRNPAREEPEVRAWSGDTPLTMGVDSACSLPVVVFPQLAAFCERYGPRQNGFLTAPIGVSWQRGRQPIVAYSHVVSSEGAPVQGLIGWPVVKHFIWHLELAGNRHDFHERLPEAVRTWPSLRIVESNVARVHLPGVGECILDTGAPFGLYLSREEWRRFLAANPDLRIGVYFGESPAAGGSFKRPYVCVKELQLGPWHLRNIRVCESFSALTGPRMFGREALAQFEIWLDGPSRRLYYCPLEG